MQPLFSFWICCRLAFDNSTRGASVGAGAAAHALISIDLVDVAFGDSSNRAFASAGTTSNASVGNFVSHFLCVFGVNRFAKIRR